jgi:hypothetical protein
MLTGLIGRVVSGNWLSKHALLTAFFPNLVFLALIGGLIVSPGSGGIDSITTPIAFLFVALVVACTYFTMNVQPGLLRLYRGEWNSDGMVSKLVGQQRREFWRNRLQKHRDREVEAAYDQACLEQLRFDIARYDQAIPTATPTRDDVHDVRTALRNLSLPLSIRDEVTVTRAAARSMELKPRTGPALTGEDLKDFLAAREQLRFALVARMSRIDTARDAERQWYRDERRRQLPGDPKLIGPTRLANIFGACDDTLRRRYGLQPWLLTTHLRMALPSGFAETLLDDAKLGLDLSVTLSALLLVYGVIISLVVGSLWPHLHFLGARVTVTDGWQTTVAVVGIVTGTLVTLVAWFALRVAGILLFALMLAGILVRFGDPANPLAKFGAFISLIVLSVVLSVLAYYNATEAATVYCEGIKTLFDTHRSRVLTALRLRVPSRLDDERPLWKQLCDQLDNIPPKDIDPRYVVYANDATTALPAVADDGASFEAFVATRPLAPMTVMTRDDFRSARLFTRGDGRHVPTASVTDATNMVVLSSVGPNEPLLEHYLITEAEFKGRAVCVVPVRAALSPVIRTGARVTLMFGADNHSSTSPSGTSVGPATPTTVSFRDLIVSAISGPALSTSPPPSVPSDTNPVPDASITLLVPDADLRDLAPRLATNQRPIVILQRPAATQTAPTTAPMTAPTTAMPIMSTASTTAAK